jgi:hypothetical protein
MTDRSELQTVSRLVRSQIPESPDRFLRSGMEINQAIKDHLIEAASVGNPTIEPIKRRRTVTAQPRQLPVFLDRQPHGREESIRWLIGAVGVGTSLS